MMDVREKEQEKLWDSILTLANIDKEQAKVVFKAAIERSFRSFDMFTPFISRIPLKVPDCEHVQKFKQIEKQVMSHLTQKQEDKAYELLVEYIDTLSGLTEFNSTIIRRRLIASLLKEKHQPAPMADQIAKKDAGIPALTISKEGEESSYYTPKEVSKKLGISDQTVRRMCDRGKFPGAYQTDGGHWKIPKEDFITTEEQDKKADEILRQIDVVNEEAGDVDEFDL
ncbi:helix-turn-helix domain-containing protein [Virgibacillus sp. MSP4-1]|uniref:helix-turn-helix domain-containing protein n=1 Tax=Virgibacillus sp. MSP4-1 TaxID=2700081 RepID=UPI0003A7C1F2|nr:helix-turn-helix domain-containing protein [Virgibacillus sp. MSP4-1]QHS23773.1 helix-turn-helix domain-containing protein [Virgibacillus sp. MSP4-1]